MVPPSRHDLREDLAVLHQAALAAADPVAAVRRELSARLLDAKDGWVGEGGRTRLVAVGKAAVGMARAACELLGEGVAAGAVIHPRGDPWAQQAVWPRGVQSLAAGHPLPDEDSVAAGEAVARLLEGTRASDCLLVLLSGGASSLLERLRPGVSLDDLRAVTLALQRAGVDIEALNTVRRALSTLKGGGLARLAAPARVTTLALSDVVGDAPEAIGSGPTVPSPTGAAEALAVLDQAGIARELPRVAAVLRAAAEDPREAPPLGAAATGGGEYRIVGSNRMAAAAVATAAARRGFSTRVAVAALRGEAREVGAALAREALGARGATVSATSRPLCLVWGGETTVTVSGSGRGGRNLELALGAAEVLAGYPGVALLAFATDGVDGTSGAAGALATGETLARAAALGLSAERALADNDTAPFFRALGDLWVTGPTGTNVNDLALALVYPEERAGRSYAPGRGA